MQHYSIAEIKTWDRFYRANFINCLSGFKSATLIGTIGTNKVANLGVFSNLVHLGSDPALIGFINRPREAAPHTLANIEATGVYTMNHIHPSFIQQAHQASAKYAADESEFEATGLGIEWRENCTAPFVAESKIKYAMELVEIIPIRHNGTFFIIGKVLDVYIDKTILARDGYLHLEKADSVCSLGIDGYYATDLLGRFAHARPGKPIEQI
ncbi:flavin reductase [Ferruginibacter paludis]|uniref:flavin reductase family protein n=1 Tax=Ferruginibacter paludis TaxID=1310417 RepID=UPI0025B58A66|nr:flavin reductase [Ferruginibacter paludis]MDN3654363.1 flavin reductase [Ferruginibacter paludis]